MLDLDPKTIQAMAPYMERVLIVEPGPAAARMLTELLRNLWRPAQVWTAASTPHALSLAQGNDPQLVFTEFAGDELEGLEFTRKLRRSDYSCRKAPVIMVTAHATPAAILGARDCGVHEFLRKPFTNKDLIRRIEAVTRHPRGWVEGIGYVGPDRRRFNSADYKGTRKRRTDVAADPLQGRLIQALRIVAAALPALETDPFQARRALSAQASELQQVAQAGRNGQLASAAAALSTQLNVPGKVTRVDIEPYARPLLALLPAEDVRPRTAA